MTHQEKYTVVDRASGLFQEWIEYIRESGANFNLPPRLDYEDAKEYWNEKFMSALDSELEELTTD